MTTQYREVRQVPIEEVRLDDGLVEYFPDYTGKPEFEDLVERIKNEGQQVPVKVIEREEEVDGIVEDFYSIVDGRHRFKALEQLGQEILVEIIDDREYDALVSYVCNENLHRRHLSGSQKATTIALITGRQERRKGVPPSKLGMSTIGNMSDGVVSRPYVTQARRLYKLWNLEEEKAGTNSVENYFMKVHRDELTLKEVYNYFFKGEKEKWSSLLESDKPFTLDVVPTDPQEKADYLEVQKAHEDNQKVLQAVEEGKDFAQAKANVHRETKREAIKAVQDEGLGLLDPDQSDFKVFHGNLRKFPGSDLIPAQSIDAIVTDPPYEFTGPQGEANKEAFRHLGRFAAWALKHGGDENDATRTGNMFVMCGDNNIYKKIQLINQGYISFSTGELGQRYPDSDKVVNLEMVGIIHYVYPKGGQLTKLERPGQSIRTKTILWFRKGNGVPFMWGGMQPNTIFPIHKGAKEQAKQFEQHKWKQDEVGFKELVERYTFRGDLICDPFVGSGTTGLAVVRSILDPEHLKEAEEEDATRRFWGIDIEETSARQSELVISNLLKGVEPERDEDGNLITPAPEQAT